MTIFIERSTSQEFESSVWYIIIFITIDKVGEHKLKRPPLRSKHREAGG
jgi:hypothetical protein